MQEAGQTESRLLCRGYATLTPQLCSQWLATPPEKMPDLFFSLFFHSCPILLMGLCASVEGRIVYNQHRRSFLLLTACPISFWLTDNNNYFSFIPNKRTWLIKCLSWLAEILGGLVAIKYLIPLNSLRTKCSALRAEVIDSSLSQITACGTPNQNTLNNNARAQGKVHSGFYSPDSSVRDFRLTAICKSCERNASPIQRHQLLAEQLCITVTQQILATNAPRVRGPNPNPHICKISISDINHYTR